VLAGADLTCDLGMGSAARLVKRGTAKPATLTLTGVDLGYADRLFNQADALDVRGGTMDVTYSIGDDHRITAAATLHDLRVAQNPDSAADEFLFVPVSRITDYVDAQGGDLTLRFDVGEWSASQDLEFFARASWVGMLTEVIQRSKPGEIKRLAQRLRAAATKPVDPSTQGRPDGTADPAVEAAR
jgi:hypothetical protein